MTYPPIKDPIGRAQVAERRVAELEAALREVLLTPYGTPLPDITYQTIEDVLASGKS